MSHAIFVPLVFYLPTLLSLGQDVWVFISEFLSVIDCGPAQEKYDLGKCGFLQQILFKLSSLKQTLKELRAGATNLSLKSQHKLKVTDRVLTKELQ